MQDNPNAVERIRKDFARLYSGPAWHGPSIKPTLDAIDPAKIFEKGPTGSSMADMVDHILFWRKHLIELLKGNFDKEATEAQGWEDLGSKEIDWEKRMAFMDWTHDEIEAQLLKFPEEKLDTFIPGRKKLSFRELLKGVMEHDMYHLGQLQFIRKTV